MENFKKEFCALILTHGRPNKVFTYQTLLKSGYTGEIYLVVDNEDKHLAEYQEKYGKERVIIFDKKKVSKEIDNGDNFNDRRAIIYARNASFKIAEKLGFKYFIQLDDDYTAFNFKFDENNTFKETLIQNLDRTFKSLLDYYKSINVLSIAMAQNGDFIGGAKGGIAKGVKVKRKAMNSFICSTERPFKFIGRINEDVNTYTNLGNRGGIFFTIPLVSLIQKQTQSNKGGMTDLYLDSGTYVKSFYTVMYSPFCTTITEMGHKNKRLHHRVQWRNAVPMIIREKYKKKE